MKKVQEENHDTRMATPKVISDDNRTASEDTVLSASVSPDQGTNEPRNRGAARPLSQDVPSASVFGMKVATIIDDIWALYNVPRQVKHSDFSSEHHVEMLWDRDLATYDFDALTQLVIRCHDACVRVSVSPCNMRYMRIMFHPRVGREGAMFERHPTIEDAILRVRARTYFGARRSNEQATTLQSESPSALGADGGSLSPANPASRHTADVDHNLRGPNSPDA